MSSWATYPNAKSIAVYVAESFGVKYTPEGLTHLLHRLGFVYKKTKPVPGKADPEKQKSFLEVYHQLKDEKGPNDRIYFVDGAHPNHNAMPAYGWIAKGVTKEIPTNTARKRINLNGALDILDFDLVIREDPTLNPAVDEAVAIYNQTPHESLQNVSPNDVYAGRKEAILKAREEKKRLTLERRKQYNLNRDPDHGQSANLNPESVSKKI